MTTNDDLAKEVADMLEKDYFETREFKIPENISEADLTNLMEIENPKFTTLLHLAVSLDCKEAVQKFISLGSNPNFETRLNSPLPIFLAHSKDVIGILLDAGADIHLKVHKYSSFFEFVCMTLDYQVINFLLQKDPNLLKNIKEKFNLHDTEDENVIDTVLGIVLDETSLSATIF